MRFKKAKHFVNAARKPGKKAGSVRLARQAAFFCLDFSLLLSFDQAKESKDQSTGFGIKLVFLSPSIQNPLRPFPTQVLFH